MVRVGEDRRVWVGYGNGKGRGRVGWVELG